MYAVRLSELLCLNIITQILIFFNKIFQKNIKKILQLCYEKIIKFFFVRAIDDSFKKYFFVATATLFF